MLTRTYTLYLHVFQTEAYGQNRSRPICYENERTRIIYDGCLPTADIWPYYRSKYSINSYSIRWLWYRHTTSHSNVFLINNLFRFNRVYYLFPTKTRKKIRPFVDVTICVKCIDITSPCYAQSDSRDSESTISHGYTLRYKSTIFCFSKNCPKVFFSVPVDLLPSHRPG